MSFDLFLMGFRDGDVAVLDGDRVAAALEPYLRRRGVQEILAVGAAEGQIYGLDDLTTGFMVNHMDPALYDVLYAVSVACDLVVIAPGYPIALVDDAQRAHLPANVDMPAVLVRSGAELRDLPELPG